MKSRAAFWVALVTLVAAQSGHAGICNAQMTRLQCKQAYRDQMAPMLAVKRTDVEQNIDAAGRQSTVVNTGNANSAAELPTSSHTDFFNLLQANASKGGEGKDDPEALGFEFNACGTPNAERRRLTCQLRARAQKPDLYAPLKKALDDANLETRASTLQDGLSVTDEATVGVFFSLVGDNWGSSLSPASIALFDELMREADDLAAFKTGNASVDTPSDKLTTFLNDSAANDNLLKSALIDSKADLTAVRLGLIQRVPDASLKFVDIVPSTVFTADFLTRVIDEYEAFAKADVAVTMERFGIMQSLGADSLAQLINLQPQLYAGVEYGAKSRFAGPDGLRAKIAYEAGFANLRGYRRFEEAARKAGRACSKADGPSSCLKLYLSDPAVQANLQTGLRLAATVEYVRQRRFDVAIPDTMVRVSTPSAHSWAASLALGRYLSGFGVDQKTRLDLVASYQDVSNDPRRRDRGMATATISRQISDDWVFSVGLVYASKSEFRADPDKDLSVRLGLNYKFLRKML
jgi:hypothetical protein